MKKPIYLILVITMLLAFTKTLNAQKSIQTDDAIYTLEGEYDFKITKTDIKTKRVLFKADTKIPDKNKKESYYPLGNSIYMYLIGDNVFIVYDVWQKATSSKDCFVKLLNVNTGKFSEPKLLYSTKLNSVFSVNELVYKPFYSPDNTKMAVLKDNISAGYNIDPEINIYDTETFDILSSKKMSGKYEGQKRIFDLTNISMDNNGNITTLFHLLNLKTKVTTKSYSAEIPFNETDLKNINELEGNASNDAGGNQNAHGRFYKSLEDYIDDKPIQGVRIKNGSYSWSTFGGSDYKLIDDNGNIKKEATKDLPSDIFTYKKDNVSNPYLIRVIDKKPYIVLAVGKLNYYSLYTNQEERYYSEGWNGELEKFKESVLTDYLKKYGLLEAYKKDKPKREFQDDVNEYFNKTIKWQIKYFNLLNEQIE